jgi:nucleotide sugar dehydrogenase
MQKVSIIGLGYVGLPLALAIKRSKKFDLVSFDINQEKVDKINKGICPITDEVARNDLEELELEATTDPTQTQDSDFFLICVPTPVLDDYTPDYKPIKSASKTVSKYMKKGSTVILESTVNPGASEEVMLPVLEKGSGLKAGKEFNVGMCPERINPGDPEWNVYNIARNVGSLVSSKTEELVDFYKSFLDAEVNAVSSLKVAEATKIVENTFRDINIAYVNELAKSFDAMGIDLVETLQGASNKPFAFLPHWPGRGVGGHCIAVDPYYLIKRAAKSGFNHQFLKIARDINNSMPKYAISRLQDGLNSVQKPIKGTEIALLGLSYKENIADLRESPCLIIKEKLEKMGAVLHVFDPFTPKLNTVQSLQEALSNAEAVFLCTAHDEFAGLEDKLVEYKDIEVVVDGMNKLDKEKMNKLGLVYRGIGK